ncbi:MAG TPA: metallophosphoesterase [Candidatus Limnocylindria bacterium]
MPSAPSPARAAAPRLPRGVAALLLAIIVIGVPPIQLQAASRATTPGAIIWAVGDIGVCKRRTDTLVANLIERHQGTVLTLGDHAYPAGSVEDFAHCFDPPWQDLIPRTHPAPGNHEYRTADGGGYFAYFGDRARGGYYAFTRGEWRIYSLNSSALGGGQLDWLAADLAAHPVGCSLAYWHEPLFTSHLGGPTPAVKAFWDLLATAGVDVVLNGHAHDYERFAPQTPDAVAADDGIREFIVGTGGRTLGGFGDPAANSEVRQAKTWGALRMRLAPGGYSWQFYRAAGEDFTDSGTGVCH